MPAPSDHGSRPPLAYVGSKLDRVSEQRGDAKLIESATRHPGARAVLIGGELVLLRQAGGPSDPFFPLTDVRSLGAIGEPILIGIADGAAMLGYATTADAAEQIKSRSDLIFTDLRTIAMRGQVAPEHLQPIATAKAVLTWHARHGFCANCGAATQITEAGWRRDCAACGALHFPRTDPCVIMLAIDGEQCLLGRSARFPPGMWSCLAGFVEPGESLEEAVRRETLEEAGIATGRVVYFASQPWPFPMSLMIGCFAQAATHEIKIDPNEIEDARWVAREEAALMLARQHPDGLMTPPPLAIAHHIIRAYVERGAAVLGANEV